MRIYFTSALLTLAFLFLSLMSATVAIEDVLFLSSSSALSSKSASCKRQQEISFNSTFFPPVMHKYALCLFTSGGALFNQADEHFGHFVTLQRYKKTINI